MVAREQDRPADLDFAENQRRMRAERREVPACNEGSIEKTRLSRHNMHSVSDWIKRMQDEAAQKPQRAMPAPEPERKTTIEPKPAPELAVKPEPENNDLLLKLIKAAQISGQGLYLYGEAGIGKSYGIEAAAKKLGLDFYTTGACLDDVPLKGFRDAAGNYHETQLYKAVVNGGLFLLDEMDVCSSEVLLALNQLLANRACEFGGEIVHAHENFIFCATGNTDLDGGDETYNGRQIIDKSFKTRFILHHVVYNAGIAEQIAGKQLVDETTAMNGGRPIIVH
jgi:MoxR-like ATPase